MTYLKKSKSVKEFADNIVALGLICCCPCKVQYQWPRVWTRSDGYKYKDPEWAILPDGHENLELVWAAISAHGTPSTMKGEFNSSPNVAIVKCGKFVAAYYRTLIYVMSSSKLKNPLFQEINSA